MNAKFLVLPVDFKIKYWILGLTLTSQGPVCSRLSIENKIIRKKRPFDGNPKIEINLLPRELGNGLQWVQDKKEIARVGVSRRRAAGPGGMEGFGSVI